MREAWRLSREFGLSMSEAMKQAWLVFKLKAMMAKGIAEFFYKTIGGKVIHAHGTLLNVPKTKSNRGTSAMCQVYYDMDVLDWRSYRKENLLVIA